MQARSFIVATVVLAGACAPAMHTVVGTGQAMAGQRDGRLVGTWELVSTVATRNDSTIMQGGPPDIMAVKILNATDYAVITRRGGQFMRAGGGRYTLSGSTYTEMVDIASGQYAPNTSATFTITLEGDRWTTEGGTTTTRFREVWRRVR